MIEYPLVMRFALASLVCLALLVTGCDCSGDTPRACRSGADCPPGASCIDRTCTIVDGGDEPPDALRDDGAPLRSDASGPACDSGGSCAGDARCVAGTCVPYEPGGFDETCRRVPSPGPVRPQIQCAFETAPEGDPQPSAVRALHTPLVADLGITEGDRPSRPSIVYVGDYGYVEGVPRVCEGRGVLRVLDGATCRSQGVWSGIDLNSPVTPAIGDLDGDGRPEIVAAATAGGLAAFTVASTGAITLLWSTTLADGSADTWGITECQWGAIALYDLDDDASPEILFEGAVWSASGVRIATLPGWAHVGTGAPIDVGDHDRDGRVEAIAGHATWEFDPATDTFAIESGFSTTVPAGYVAVADLGAFPGVAGDVVGGPEVVVASGGVVYVRTLGGGQIDAIPTTTSGSGGPPTIADFDGDGVREIGVAFGGSYEVLDLAEGDRRLWTQPSQDTSSSRTGSSVFDFNADGRAEVVYGDECFVRVYDGTTGEVLFSQAHFSSTWTENPIVADVDGDGSAEMVMGSSNACTTPYCPAIDPIFAGLRCDVGADCPSGTCDAGLCRCGSDAECGATYGCTAPIEGTAGTGNVCRAYHRDCVAGVRVYRDGRDRWASSRTIWNQHGYHVTNVGEDGTIPRTSAVMANWADPTLNNYRQNVQGALGATPGPDLTIRSITAVCGATGSTDMRATLCNRGVVFLDVGVQVVFDQVGDGGRTRLCDLRTTEPVAPGECTDVACTAPVPADGVFEASADEEGLIGECREANNAARSEANCLL
jgi:hypothetical protein